MKEERYFYAPKAEIVNELPQDEAIHATRVLRLKEDDEIYLIDGCGFFYKAKITMSSPKRCMYTIKEKLKQDKSWEGHIHIVMAPTKMMERIEWMAEKATEIGIDEISFIECQYSERRSLRTERIDKIVVAAIKQSHKAWKPKVNNNLIPFSDFLKQNTNGQKYICHCYNEIERTDLFELLNSNKTKEDITIMIGPEGDFSIDEVRQAIKHGFKPVSLGKSRLRTETAALSAVMMAQLTMRK
jgi:16S rRNA (uracil1498-N3)-methyltransferase